MINIYELLEKLNDYEAVMMSLSGKNLQKKYENVRIFSSIREVLNYQIAKKPINISEDGMVFQCPTCKTIMESEDGTWDKYDFCDICGQRFKDKDTLLEKLMEEEE